MLEHFHAIIRAAVNAAVRERLIGDDPARYVELPPARRPHAVVRTDDQIRVWRRTGVRPVVATWTLAGIDLRLDAVRRRCRFAELVGDRPPERAPLTGE
jgi:hypothetical protein